MLEAADDIEQFERCLRIEARRRLIQNSNSGVLHKDLGKPKPLEEYGSEYPQLFGHVEVVQELAFEEYRQRLQAGRTVDPSEYRDRFGVDVSQWPAHSRRPSTQIEDRTRMMESVCMIEGLPQTTEANAAIAESVRKSLPAEALARFIPASDSAAKRLITAIMTRSSLSVKPA